MSFYTDRDKGIAPQIEMPPLPEENTPQPAPQEVQQPAEVEQVEVVDNLSATEETVDNTSAVEEEPERPIQKESRANARIRELAEEKKRAERERDELMKLLMQQQIGQQKQQPAHEEDVDNFDVDDDALVEGKSLRKMHQEMREIKKELKAYKSNSAQEQERINQAILETKIKAAHPDFDEVVSKDNVAVFAELYPELATTLAANKDPYSQAKSAYLLLKQLGIYKNPIIESDKARAIKNAAKPRPLASIGTLQGESAASRENAFANGPLSDDLKNKYWAEMQAAMKG